MAASYSSTDTSEIKSIAILYTLLDQSKVKADLKFRDKLPNIDGYIELIDDMRRPYGKLEVQVKTIGDTSKEDPKYPCPLSLFTYSEGTCNPVVLIGVDTIQVRAYWIHIHKKILNGRVLSVGQKTVSLSFPLENIIDRDDDAYIDYWMSIVKNYQRRLHDYDELYDEYLKIEKITNPALGALNLNFIEMHEFLDYYNNLLNTEFKIVSIGFKLKSYSSI